MSSVTIQNVTKTFGNTTVLENFDAVFADGEFITLLGPSGCGKTTMLRIIAGFEKPTSGSVLFDDRVVSSDKVFIPPEKRDIGMVFQSYAVWPHMTVFDNVAYPLQIKKVDKAAIRQKVEHVLEVVHLAQYRDRIPSQLSGGQQQRVALARALPSPPCFFWTSRCPIWTQSCGKACALRSRTFRSSTASRWYTSRTTRPRPWP